MGALLLFALLLLLHRRHARRAQLATVERDLSDLQHQRFQEPPFAPQPVYEEISEAEPSVAEPSVAEYAYEEPVPVSIYNTLGNEKKEPVAFHNPLYGGPLPVSTGTQDLQTYANPKSFSSTPVHVYDLGEDIEA